MLGGTAREWEHLLRDHGHSRAAARQAVHRLFSDEGEPLTADATLRRLAAQYFGDVDA